jgi:hypothetical protein
VDGLTALLDPLALSGLVINLLLGALLASGVAWYYARFGEAFANRVKLARLLPVLCLTTVLVISVVKASLALSLGLVGALSIVRFRTAIKEPEELLYLFIAIAIGIGLGADQRLPTIVAIGVLLVYLISTRSVSWRSHQQNLYLNVRVPEREDANMLESVSDILRKHADRVDMRRLDRQDHTVQLTFFLDCKDPQKLARLVDDLKANLPGCSFSFVDQGDMPR